MKDKQVLVVGTGLTGIVCAERLASKGHKVTIIDKRNHIGGNCYDYYDKNGILIHKYGPHQFRTNSKKVKNYLSKFTEWKPYTTTQKSFIDGSYYTFPINMNTINEVFKTEFQDSKQVKKFIDLIRVKNIPKARNSEEFVTSRIGWKLYEMFYKDYTIKQWGIHPSKLESLVCGRVPIYYNKESKYVKDKETILPKEGYTKMFEKMLDSDDITIKLNTPCSNYEGSFDNLIWTGKIDEFFNYKFGKLPYRSLKFELKKYDEEFHNKWYKIAYPTMEVDQTRDIEIKYLTGQKNKKTVIMREFPSSVGEPYYPIPNKENEEIYLKYKKEADKIINVSFVGRLAEYRYLDMDECVLDSLNVVKNGKI